MEHREDVEPWGVLTGDTLFIGDVGRPDLLASVGATAEDLAGRLYESLHGKLLTLPDATRVWPAHGAGSACGKNLSTATTSTIGDQRRDNYALQPMSRERFVAIITEGQPAAPDYFAHDASPTLPISVRQNAFNLARTRRRRPSVAGRSLRETRGIHQATRDPLLNQKSLRARCTLTY